MLLEVLCRAVFYPAGWVFLKAVTLGRWAARSSWISLKPDSEWVVALGATLWVIVILVAFRQFG